MLCDLKVKMNAHGDMKGTAALQSESFTKPPTSGEKEFNMKNNENCVSSELHT